MMRCGFVIGVWIGLVLCGCGDDSDSTAGSNADMGSTGTPGPVPGADSSAEVDAGAGSTPDLEPTPVPIPEPTTSKPADGTQEALAAFLEAEGYRGDGWTAQTDAPREMSHAVSPHGRVRVWRNDALLASQAAGNGVDLDAPAHDSDSMAVKEFYDADDAMLGRATMLKLDGDLREWAYFCSGPDQRCMDSSPVYGVGFGVSCSFCHGGLVFTNTP